MSTLCVSTLCVSTLCVSTLCVSSLCVTTLCEHSMGARTQKSTKITTKNVQILGPDVAEHRKVGKLPRKVNISPWAVCCSAKNVKKARVLL